MAAKAYTLLYSFLIISFYSTAQTQITGKVLSEKNKPIPYANIWLDSLYDGATTDHNGAFNFSSEYQGEALLIISCLGYQTQKKAIMLKGNKLMFDVKMKSKDQKLNVITISAGSFEASDEKKAVLLKPLDIVQTPGAQADIFGAIQKLPGVQPMGDETGIFVRGGEAYETRTFIDGSVVDNPFFSDVPQVPGRGRFDPFLFKGTMFSTGAYSAEFGQALSSILALETQDVPMQTGTAIGLNAAGMSISHTKNWRNTSIFGDISYTNIDPLYTVSQTFGNFSKPPEGAGGSLGFRQKTGGKGLIKGLFQFNTSKLGINYPQFTGDEPINLSLKNNNFLANTHYKRLLGEKWDMQLSFSYSSNYDDITEGSDEIPSWEYLGQGKMVLATDLNRHTTFKAGSEWQIRKGIFGFNEFERSYKDQYNGSFVEVNMNPFEKVAIRVGIRSNYNAYINDFRIVPRISAAYALGENSQVSLAYGQFTQAPTNEFLRKTNRLAFETSQHFLANYQWMTERYTLRIEAYHKRYDDLVLMTAGESILEDPNAQFANDGDGYARGIDIFWRDKKAFDRVDYWLTYSFLDTERLYRDFAQAQAPRFAAAHTAQAIIRANFNERRLQLGSGFTFSSGRPFYFGTEHPEWSNALTPNYYQLSFNASYVTALLQQFTVFYFSVNNPLGWQNITSYEFNADYSERLAISPPIGRQFFIGIFINIK